jgi:hypothetical protein
LEAGSILPAVRFVCCTDATFEAKAPEFETDATITLYYHGFWLRIQPRAGSRF